MDILNDILQKQGKNEKNFKSINVEKHLEVEYDLGALLVVDKNELKPKLLSGSRESYLLEITRDNTQLLFNRIWGLPSERIDEAIVVRLPPRRTTLPRSKPVPRPRPLTKWQQFAKAKGITKKKKDKLSWDDQLRKWVPLFGYKKAKAEHEKDWVLEVPDNVDPNEDMFLKRSEAKNERIAKNELQRLRNIARAKRVNLPRVGIANPEVSSAKDLEAAVTVAKASTASLGRFQPKLPKEKDARGVAAITPGASNRKRKLQPVPADQEKTENMNIVESVLNKKPKLDIEKAISRHINNEQLERSEEKQDRVKSGRVGKDKGNKSKTAKKPKGGQGQRKGGKTGKGGRKRR